MDKIYHTVVKKEPIATGWSDDKKYCVTTMDGTKYLLRVSPLSRYGSKKMVFAMMEKMAALDIPMCLPVEFGICSEGVYSMQSWIYGEDFQTILPLSGKTLRSERDQYAWGLQSGKIIKKVHAIAIPEPWEEWEVKFNREIDEKTREYHRGGLRFDGDCHVLSYMEKNRRLLRNRPQCFCLGDYTVINMMLENNELRIIDFERYEIGDPWHEFNCIVWSAMASPYFATGQIHGYFDGDPPMDFFKLLALYNSVLLLSLLSSWGVTSEFGRAVSLQLSQDMLKWFDNMDNPVPAWYFRR